MKNLLISRAVVVQMLFAIALSAQISDLPPKNFIGGSPIETTPIIHLDHNSKERLTRELLDTNTINVIAGCINLTERERQAFVVAPGPAGEEVWLYLLDATRREIYERFAQPFSAYVRHRVEGHSQGWTLRAVTNRIRTQSLADGDLHPLIAKQPFLPDSWLKRENSGSITNPTNIGPLTIVRDSTGRLYVTNEAPKQAAGSAGRWVSFIGIDSEIAWRYTLYFSRVDSFERIDEWRLDAKEVDPKYKNAFEAVEKEIEREYPRSGRQFGSHIVYVQMKKEKLKARGINWRSPSDLNPSVTFD